MKAASLTLPILGLALIPAHAVVVLSGANHMTPPSSGTQPYYNNVGIVGGGSAIYLGGGWVLTAAHVAGSLPASATFGGTSYSTVGGSFHRLTNDLPLSALTDISLFQISSPPSLPSLAIRSSTVTVGTDVMMIGNGRTQAATKTYWNVAVGPGDSDDVWTTVTPPPPADHEGFTSTATRTMNWGNNTVSGTATIDYGAGDVVGFLTTFDLGAFTDETQALVGDSGGGAFALNGSTWELAGIMLAVSTFEKQPANTAIIGDETFMADLSVYRPQIMSIIPEPSSAWLALGAMAPLALMRRR